LVSQLAKEFDNIDYVKIEGALAIAKMSELRMQSPETSIFGGDGCRRMIAEFEVGAKGFIPAPAMSEIYVDAFRNLESGNIEEARKASEQYMTFLRFGSLHPMSWEKMQKETLRILGVIDSSYVREPSVPLPLHCQQDIKDILAKMELNPFK
jgi:dihydrodipicolinate synthase/N-acetylneuraminate lyase